MGRGGGQHSPVPGVQEMVQLSKIHVTELHSAIPLQNDTSHDQA